MLLNEALARQIVIRAMKIIDYSVNVMDRQGIIIASGDPERLFERHEGAILALTQHRVVEIDESMLPWLKGVKPGINLPIYYQQQPIGVIGVSGDPNKVRHYAELMRMTTELILEQADYNQKLQWDKRYREELVLELIRPNQDQHSVVRTARFLHIDLTLPRVAWVVTLSDPATLHAFIQRLEQLDSTLLIAVHGLEQVVILKTLLNKELENNLDKSSDKTFKSCLKEFKVTAGVGGYFSDPHNGLYLSWQTAKSTLEYGCKLLTGKRIFQFYDYQLPVLINLFRDSWQGEQLSQPINIIKQHDTKRVLLKTLQCYFSYNCDLNHAAKILFIHPNTMRYRLKQIESILSIDINKLDSIVALYLGLQLQN